MTESVKPANSPVNEPVNVDVKLGINKFHVDEGHPHIIIRETLIWRRFIPSRWPVRRGYTSSSRMELSALITRAA